MAPASAPSPPGGAARPIVQLDELTINRIAAGEVIHRPASAVKEMLENCIDAGARSVTISASSGGLKLLEIADDGRGIAREDLPLVCERFATSKLHTYTDLETIATFGFRGEALASISHVAHVSVTSMPEGAPCAYRATYADGKLVPEAGGASADPRPCARTRGTTITVQDLFYNAPARLKAMRSASEEYGRILDVVGKYAIAYPEVSVACRKVGAGGGASGASAELHTRAAGDATAAVRSVYGAAIARELLTAAAESELEPSSLPVRVAGRGAAARPGAAPPTLRLRLLCTNANFSAKKVSTIIFVNGRLVECAPVRHALEREYEPFLPRGSHPWALVQIDVPPERVDVNVHPTKADVHLADESEAVSLLQATLRDTLANANASRTFATVSQLPPAPQLVQTTLGAARKRRADEADDCGTGAAVGACAAAGGAGAAAASRALVAPDGAGAAALGAHGGARAGAVAPSAAGVAGTPRDALLGAPSAFRRGDDDGSATPAEEEATQASSACVPDPAASQRGGSVPSGPSPGGGAGPPSPPPMLTIAELGGLAFGGEESGDGDPFALPTGGAGDGDTWAADEDGRGGGRSKKKTRTLGGADGGARAEPPAPVYPQHAVRVNRASQRGALDAFVVRSRAAPESRAAPGPEHGAAPERGGTAAWAHAVERVDADDELHGALTVVSATPPSAALPHGARHGNADSGSPGLDGGGSGGGSGLGGGRAPDGAGDRDDGDASADAAGSGAEAARAAAAGLAHAASGRRAAVVPSAHRLAGAAPGGEAARSGACDGAGDGAGARDSGGGALRVADVSGCASTRSAALGSAIEADCGRSACPLTSIRELRAAVDAQRHAGLTPALGASVWVGSVDERAFLTQEGTRLLLINAQSVTAELFYQLALSKWGEAVPIHFAAPVPLEALATLAVRAAAGATHGGAPAAAELESAGAPAALEPTAAEAAQVRAIVSLLEAKAEMLHEYLSVVVAGGCLAALPQLVTGYVPPLSRLPEFLLTLATDVNWAEEKPCFEGLARALGALYAVRMPEQRLSAREEREARARGSVRESAAEGECEGADWTLRHVVLPRLGRATCYAPPSRHARDGTVTQVACTQTLYRIFERC